MLRIIASFCLAMAFASPASAALQLSIESKVVDPGQPVSIDVTIASDSADTLLAYAVEFEVSRIVGSVGILEFSGIDAIPDYVMPAPPDSSGQTADVPPAALTINVSDGIDQGTSPTVPSTGAGLVRLLLSPNGIFPTMPGDVYRIRLLSYTFLDDQGNELTLNPSPRDGRVSVRPVAVVPEPGTALLAALGAMIPAVRLGRRQFARRRHA